MLRYLSVGAVLGPLALAASAQSPTGDEIKSWVAEQRAAAGEPWAFPGMMMEFEIAWGYVLPKPELRAMRQRVEGKPDHPDRASLEQYEERVASGARKSRKRIWLESESTWRIAGDTDAGYVDFGRSGHAAWSLVPSQLNISDVKNPPPANDYASQLASAKEDLRALLFGPIALYWYSPAEIVVTVSPTGDWSATLQNDQDRVVFSGVWSTEHGRPIITRSVYNTARPELADWDGMSMHAPLESWQYHAESDRLLARRVVWLAADGIEDKRIDLIAWGPSQLSAQALARVPELGRPDPLRGPLTIAAAYDRRADAQRAVVVDPDGVRSVSLSPKGDVASSWLRLLGLVLVVGLVGAMVKRALRRNAASV